MEEKLSFKYKIKRNKMDCTLQYNEEYKFYTLKALDGNKEMAVATFLIYNDYSKRKIWLQNIETHEEYAHKGIASALLGIIEYFALTHKIIEIVGKYYPKNEYAKTFYEKNGYSITNENYQCYISKQLEFNKIKKNKDKFIKNVENADEDIF